MRKQYVFSKAKRAKNVPHLAQLQAAAKGKTRITIMLDNDLLMAFRAKADSDGTGYQTLIDQTLRQAVGAAPMDEATLRRVLREELKVGSARASARTDLTIGSSDRGVSSSVRQGGSR